MRSTAREQLARLLGGVGAGSFASRLTAPADDLVLEVKGVGPLRFPIPREQARLLLAKARPARYGRREQTLLDRRVRDRAPRSSGTGASVASRKNRFLSRTCEPQAASPFPGRGSHRGSRFSSTQNLALRSSTSLSSGAPQTTVDTGAIRERRTVHGRHFDL